MATHGKQTTTTNNNNKQQQPPTTNNNNHPTVHPSIFRTNKNVGKVGKGDMVYKHNGNNNDDKYNTI